MPSMTATATPGSAQAKKTPRHPAAASSDATAGAASGRAERVGGDPQAVGKTALLLGEVFTDHPCKATRWPEPSAMPNSSRAATSVSKEVASPRRADEHRPDDGRDHQHHPRPEPIGQQAARIWHSV